MAKENLTEKLQVLLSDSDVKALNRIITLKALDDGKRPPPISSYVRDIIKKHIEEETPEQKSLIEQKIQSIIKKHKKDEPG